MFVKRKERLTPAQERELLRKVAQQNDAEWRVKTACVAVDIRKGYRKENVG